MHHITVEKPLEDRGVRDAHGDCNDYDDEKLKVHLVFVSSRIINLRRLKHVCGRATSCHRGVVW